MHCASREIRWKLLVAIALWPLYVIGVSVAAAPPPELDLASASETPDVIHLGSRRELFLDDHLIERLDQASLKLREPQSAGSILEIDKPWEGQHNFGIGVIYSTSVAGSVRIEIQDSEGQPIPGFALKDADDVIGDELARVVTWGGKSDLASLAGKVIRLRFVLQDADLYSIQFTNDEAD